MRLLREKQQASLTAARAIIICTFEVEAVVKAKAKAANQRKIEHDQKAEEPPEPLQRLQAQLGRLGVELAPREWKLENLLRLRSLWAVHLALLETVDQILQVRQTQMRLEEERQQLEKEASRVVPGTYEHKTFTQRHNDITVNTLVHLTDAPDVQAR